MGDGIEFVAASDLGLRSTGLLIALLIVIIAVILKKRRKIAAAARVRKVKAAYESDPERAARSYAHPTFDEWRAENCGGWLEDEEYRRAVVGTRAMQRIGFMFNHREGTYPDRPYLLHRVVPMAEILAARGLQLFMYSPRHVDPDTGTVLGCVLENGEFLPVESAVPKVNGNWHIGIDRSSGRKVMRSRDFEVWAREHHVEKYPCTEFTHLVKDKYRTFKLMSTFDPTLHPHTERYDPSGGQVEEFLDRSATVYLKPRRGQRGNGVLVLKRDASRFSMIHYETKRRHVTRDRSLRVIVDRMSAIASDAPYIIQEGIDVECCGNASFIVRVIMLHDGRRWNWIHKAVVAAEGSDVSNTSQGGTNHTLRELFSALHGSDDVQWLIEKLRQVSFAVTEYLDSIYPGQLMEFALDFVLDKLHNVHVVELNTQPGMTKPGMPIEGAFRDILNRTPEEQILYERCVVPHANHLVDFLQARHEARVRSDRAPGSTGNGRDDRSAEPADARPRLERVPRTRGDRSSLRILFVGDTSFGENYQERNAERGRVNVLATKGYEYPLEKVGPLLRDAGFVIANLETPLTDLLVSPLMGKKEYIHWSDPVKAPPVLKHYHFDAVSLANNHAFDYGEGGLRQTLQALDGSGICWFGAGPSRAAAAVPLVREFVVGGRSLRLTVLAGKHRTREYEYHYYAGSSASGVNGWTEPAAVGQIQASRRADHGAFIVAFPHWGENYRWTTRRQTRLAHAMIDAGADLVIGHGAHMMQEIEQYRGRWVIYNLGNFVFNSPGRYRKFADAVPFSFAACLDVDEQAGRLDLALRLYPILTDNRVTEYQPRPVTRDELGEILEHLLDRSLEPDLRAQLGVGGDELGHFLSLRIGPMAEPASARSGMDRVPG